MSAPDAKTLTEAAREFVAANRESPVTDGYVTAYGMFYKLEDGRSFRLSHDDLEGLPTPRWLHG